MKPLFLAEKMKDSVRRPSPAIACIKWKESCHLLQENSRKPTSTAWCLHASLVAVFAKCPHVQRCSIVSLPLFRAHAFSLVSCFHIHLDFFLSFVKSYCLEIVFCFVPLFAFSSDCNLLGFAFVFYCFVCFFLYSSCSHSFFSFLCCLLSHLVRFLNNAQVILQVGLKKTNCRTYRGRKTRRLAVWKKIFRSRNRSKMHSVNQLLIMLLF